MLDIDGAFLKGTVDSRGRTFTLEAKLNRGKSRQLYSNGVRLKTAGELSGILTTVLFCPEDLMLVRAGAAARRRFLDTALCQMRPNYARYLEEYNRLHEHKTRILRDSEEKPSLLSMWEDFSLRMAHIGAQIIRYRAYYCRKLLKPRLPSMQISRRMRCSPVCTRPCRASPTRLQTLEQSKSNLSTCVQP